MARRHLVLLDGGGVEGGDAGGVLFERGALRSHSLRAPLGCLALLLLRLALLHAAVPAHVGQQAVQPGNCALREGRARPWQPHTTG